MDDFLLKNYPTKGSKYCSDILNISLANISRRVNKVLKIKSQNAGVLWTKEEELFLKENYINHGAKFCAEKLGKTSEQICDKAKRMRFIRCPKNKTFRPHENQKIEILISWEEFDKLNNKDLISYRCFGCGNIYKKSVKLIKNCIVRKSEGIYCSTKCLNIKRKNAFYETLPTKEFLENLIKQDLKTGEMGVYLNKYGPGSQNYVCRCLKYYGLKTNFIKSQHPETKAKLSKISIERFQQNPNKDFLENIGNKNNPSWISEPCEFLKKKLRERNISFQEEVCVLLHLGYYYRADIVFPEYGAIIEVNGRQHYNNAGTLKEYYQKRHDLLAKEGWRIFEIPCKEATKPTFIDEILLKIYDIKTNPNKEYQLYLPKKYYCTCGKEIAKQSQRCRKCLIKSWECFLTREQLHYFIWNYTFPAICNYFQIGIVLLRKWIKKANFKELPSDGYRSSVRSGRTIDYQI